MDSLMIEDNDMFEQIKTQSDSILDIVNTMKELTNQVNGIKQSQLNTHEYSNEISFDDYDQEEYESMPV